MKELYKQHPEKQHPKTKPGAGALLSVPSGTGGKAFPLPCLYSNNSIEGVKTSDEEERLEVTIALSSLLSPYRKRQAHTLFSNVKRLIEKEAESINHVGFLTLTFPDNVTDPKEAYRRYRSMNTNFLSKWPEVKDWICVKEQQRRGAWHYHLVVALKGDIRTGLNFREIKNRKYSSASPYLRGLWRVLREKMVEYGFGRPELLPVKSNAEAMGRYVGKYISKHIGQQHEEHKGLRLVNYSRAWLKNSVHFAWNTKNAHEWRRKLALFADYCGCSELYQLSEKLGPGWAYKYADYIMDMDQIRLGQIIDDKQSGVVRQKKEYVPRLITMMEEKQEKRKRISKEKLTLHTETVKDKKEKLRESLRGISTYLDEWKIYAVKYQIDLDRDNADLREVSRQLDVLERKKAAMVGLSMVNEGETDLFNDEIYVKEGDRAGEKIPF